MKLVFCGTPAFAVPTLNKLLGAGHRIGLVVTQPDRPQGRAMTLIAPPVKMAALAAGLPVVQPEKIRNNADFRAALEALQPDAIVVVAYGRIIPKWMIDLPLHGNLNLHASLLPKYRGAAPIQWAIANGETVTGATTMRIDEGLDTGDMLLQREMRIGPDETAEDLLPRLAEDGAGLMIETLDGIASGTLRATAQDDSRATLARILKREDGEADFNRSARVIYNRWRGFQPWPGAYTMFAGRKLTLHRILPSDLPGDSPGDSPGHLPGEALTNALPGEVRIDGERLSVVCGSGTSLQILELQLEGKRRLPAADFLHGHRLPVRLG